MKCSMCGMEFDEKNGLCSCKGCPLAKSCSFIKCPNCGYETVPDPKWAEKLRRMLSDGNKRKS